MRPRLHSSNVEKTHRSRVHRVRAKMVSRKKKKETNRRRFENADIRVSSRTDSTRPPVCGVHRFLTSAGEIRGIRKSEPTRRVFDSPEDARGKFSAAAAAVMSSSKSNRNSGGRGDGGGPAEKRRPSSTARAAVTRAAAARRRQTDERNVRRLTLYLSGGRKYPQGVRYVRKMTKHHATGDMVSFLKYASKYMRAVREDDVARFRAARMIRECYGSPVFRS